jgi:chitosanase
MMPSLKSVTLGAGIALVLSVPLAISVVAAAANDDVLISRGRLAIASTATTGFGAALATDGTAATRWASAAGPGTQWMRIDLGTTQRIDRVRLRWRSYAKAYRVQTSNDGANWTDIYATRGGNGGTDDLKRLGGRGRYVRVLATERGRPVGGYSLGDVQVFGPAGAKPTPERGSATTGAGVLAAGLENPRKKDYALELVTSAENSTLDWRREYGYIEDIHDGRGYTGGIIGFCSGTDDMLAVVENYTRLRPHNGLAAYLPALRTVDGSDSHAGLDPGFPAAWRKAAADPVFRKVQDDARDTMYFTPAVKLAKQDGLRALGQFAYYDAAVMHGVSGLRAIRAAAMRRVKTPAQNGDEITYLGAFLVARVAEMRTEEAHSDTTRVTTAQLPLLKASNLDLDSPFHWKVYGDPYSIG